MADRDWERELAEIDRRLASVPDPETAPPPPARGAARPATAAPAAPRPTPAVAAPAPVVGRTVGSPAVPGGRSWRVQLALLLRVVLGAAVIAALVVWPYPAACGTGLALFLTAIGALGLAGVATSVAAWRHRAPFVHLLGLAMLVAAGVLGAREVLPRVGYAVPTAGVGTTWQCTG